MSRFLARGVSVLRDMSRFTLCHGNARSPGDAGLVKRASAFAVMQQRR